MSISFFQPAALDGHEEARTRVIDALGATERTGDRVLCDLVRDLRRRFGTQLGLVSVLRGEVQHVLAAEGMPTGPYERRRSFCGHAVVGRSNPFCVPDLSLDPRFAGNPWVCGDTEALRFYAAALIRDARGLALGTICVAGPQARADLDAGETEALLGAARMASDRLIALGAPMRARPSAGEAAPPTSPALRP